MVIFTTPFCLKTNIKVVVLWYICIGVWCFAFLGIYRLIDCVYLSEQRRITEKRAEQQSEASLASMAQDRLKSQKESDHEKATANESGTVNEADKTGPNDSGSDGSDSAKGRPMSPDTLALMCDEEDTMFMTGASPSAASNAPPTLPCGQGAAEIYAEQERVVLSKFRDSLQMLISLGEIKGKLIHYSYFWEIFFVGHTITKI